MAESPDRPRDDATSATLKDRRQAADEIAGLIVDPKGDVVIGRAVTINRPHDELFAYWRDFANLPSFMENVVSVATTAIKRSHRVISHRLPSSQAPDGFKMFNANQNEVTKIVLKPGLDCFA